MLKESFYTASLSDFVNESSKPSNYATIQMPKHSVTEKEVVSDLLRVLLSIPSEILTKKPYSDQYEMP